MIKHKSNLRLKRITLILATALYAGAVFADTTYALEIPAQRLDFALQSLAQQSGAQILFVTKAVNNYQSETLNQELTVEQALQQLLKGKNLQIKKIADNKFSIVEGQPQARDMGQLKPIDVNPSGTASRDANAVQLPVIVVEAENESYAAKKSTVGGKTERDFKEIQQSVTVITSQRIKDQNLLNVRDALTQTTGINITGGSNATIYSRGFVLSNFQYDGGAPSLYYANYDRGSLPDLSVFDQVEVLRGADGLFSGAGESSGTVNLVRKRPLGYQQALINLSAGSWDHYRQQVDISSPLNSTGSIRGRMVAMHEQQDYFYDTADSNRNLVYGIIEADLNNKTTLAAGITYDDLDSSENYWGLPRYADGRDIGYSRKTNLQTDWTNQNTKRTQIFAELNYQLNEDWQLKLNSSWQETQNNNKIGYSFAAINPLTGQSNYFEMSKSKTKPTEILVDASINGKFDLFGHQQELLVGGNWQRYNLDKGYYSGTSTTIDALNFNPSSIAEPDWNSIDYLTTDYKVSQYGIFASLRSDLTQKLHSVIGARYSKYNYDYLYQKFDKDGNYLKTNSDQNYSTPSQVTPYFGLTYDFLPNTALYASYSQIFKPQGTNVDKTGNMLKPIEGNSLELGVKQTWLNNQLQGSLAVYQTTRENEAVSLGYSSAFPGFSCCYVASGKIQVRGIDTELNGKLTPNWDISIGYTYNDAKKKSGYSTGNGTAYSTNGTPKNQLKIWTMYRLPNQLEKWRIGGGVRMQSETYSEGTANIYDPSGNGIVIGSQTFKFTTGFYAVTGLRADYQMNQNWSLGINVDNLFDRTYWRQATNTSRNNYYGDPRNFMLTISGKY